MRAKNIAILSFLLILKVLITSVLIFHFPYVILQRLSILTVYHQLYLSNQLFQPSRAHYVTISAKERQIIRNRMRNCQQSILHHFQQHFQPFSLQKVADSKDFLKNPPFGLKMNYMI